MSLRSGNAQIIDVNDLNTAFYVYHFDESYTARNRIASFKAIINYLLLLCERIVILDSFVLNNDILTKFLEETNYEYIQEGLIVPARRSVKGQVTTFGDLFELQEKTKHIYLTNNRLHTKRLDQLPQQCVLWDLDDVAANFEKTLKILRAHIYSEVRFNTLPVFRDLLAGDFLDIIFHHATKDRDELGDKFLARNHFDHAMTSMPLSPRKIQASKRFIDSVHFSMMPNHLGLNSFYPNEFERELGPIRDLDSYVDMVKSRGRIEVSLLNWIELPAIELGVLDQLSISDLLALRATSEFTAYKNILSEPASFDLNVIKNYFDAIQELILDPRGFARRRIAQSSKFMLWKSKHGLIATVIEQVIATIPQLAVLQGVVFYLTSKSHDKKTKAFQPLLNRQLISGVDMGTKRIALQFDKVLGKVSGIRLPLPG